MPYMRDTGRVVFEIREPNMTEGETARPVVNARMVFNTYANKKDHPTYMEVAFWGELATWVVNKLLKDEKKGKGALLTVSGDFYVSEETVKGEKRTVLRMNADSVGFPKSFGRSGGTSSTSATSSAAASTATPEESREHQEEDTSTFGLGMDDIEKQLQDMFREETAS